MGLVDNFDCKITHGVVVMPLVKQIYHNFSERREQMSKFFLLSHKPIGLLISPFFYWCCKNFYCCPIKLFFEGRWKIRAGIYCNSSCSCRDAIHRVRPNRVTTALNMLLLWWKSSHGSLWLGERKQPIIFAQLVTLIVRAQNIAPLPPGLDAVDANNRCFD